MAVKYLIKFLIYSFCRYPVVLNKFAINRGSGGSGKHNGGDGVLREMLFRKEQILSVLTERRVLQPYGLQGELYVPGCDVPSRAVCFLDIYCIV